MAENILKKIVELKKKKKKKLKKKKRKFLQKNY